MILVLSHTYLKWKFSYFKYQQLHIYLIPLGNVCMILETAQEDLCVLLLILRNKPSHAHVSDQQYGFWQSEKSINFLQSRSWIFSLLIKSRHLLGWKKLSPLVDYWATFPISSSCDEQRTCITSFIAWSLQQQCLIQLPVISYLKSASALYQMWALLAVCRRRLQRMLVQNSSQIKSSKSGQIEPTATWR